MTVEVRLSLSATTGLRTRDVLQAAWRESPADPIEGVIEHG